MNQHTQPLPGRFAHGEPRFGPRVLVVDDDVMIGRFICNALQGCEVETFDDPRYALERVQCAHFDYVFCELMTPHMTGLQFCTQLIALRPELASRFTLMTAAFFDGELLSFADSYGSRLLRKPFGFVQLTRCLESVPRARA